MEIRAPRDMLIPAQRGGGGMVPTHL